MMLRIDIEQFWSMHRILAQIVTLLLISQLANADPPVAAATGPGLGEIMSAQQMRHAKLWFAGQAGNWPLAAYEVDELEEGFADVVKFHPTHRDSPERLSDLVPEMMTAPLKQLRSAIVAKDDARFKQAFDALTGACNACHQATRFGFNVVIRPTTNPYSNQRFEPR